MQKLFVFLFLAAIFDSEQQQKESIEIIKNS